MWQDTDEAIRVELAYRHERAQVFFARQRLADVARCCRVVASWWRRLTGFLPRRAAPTSVACC